MTILEEIYCDVVSAIAAAGAEKQRSICANELRAIRNRLEPMMSAAAIATALSRAERLAKQK